MVNARPACLFMKCIPVMVDAVNALYVPPAVSIQSRCSGGIYVRTLFKNRYLLCIVVCIGVALDFERHLPMRLC